ncbi:uncharacterized protein V6R79_016679 [Siganus canaliculatus]
MLTSRLIQDERQSRGRARIENEPGQFLSTTQAASSLSPARLIRTGRTPRGPDQPFHRIIIDRKSGPAERGTFNPHSRSDIGTDNKQVFSTGSAALHNPY